MANPDASSGIWLLDLVSAGRHLCEGGHGRSSAREHLDLGDHRRPMDEDAPNRRESERFERDFWKAEDIDSFLRKPRPRRSALRQGARRRRRRMAALDRGQGARSGRDPRRGSPSRCIRRSRPRPTGSPTGSTSSPRSARSRRSSVCSAPCWGIMRSFTGDRRRAEYVLAVVAPGIAEALFATAIGLFAAIPAVIAYNRFSTASTASRRACSASPTASTRTLSRELETEA